LAGVHPEMRSFSQGQVEDPASSAGEDENFNRRNTFGVFRRLKFESDAEIAENSHLWMDTAGRGRTGKGDTNEIMNQKIHFIFHFHIFMQPMARAFHEL
jgi:hypothetical protein